jgi:hypothetical protein
MTPAGTFVHGDSDEDVEFPSVVNPLSLDIASTNFLRSIEAYYSNMFDSGNHIPVDVGRHYPPLVFGGEFLTFHNLIALGRQGDAFIVLNGAFDMIKPLLQAGHPRLLTYLMESMAFSRSVGHEEVARKLITFFTFMSAQVLGRSHALTVFASVLRQAGDDVLPGIIEAGLQCMADRFAVHLGAAHSETMGLLLTSSAILKHQKSYWQASARLERLLTLYENAFGSVSYQASHALADHAAVKTEMGDLHDAEGLMVEAMLRAEKIGDPKERVESQIRCLMNTSTLCKAQGDTSQMIRSLQLALDIGGGMLDPGHWMMRHVRATLAEVSPAGTIVPVIRTPPSSGSASSGSMCILTPTSSPPE